jgi:uncharacterized protein YndB with AHSA1/START domain
MIAGEEVIHELLLPVAPAEAFEMFVDPARLVRWIGISAELEPRPGGRFRFEVMPGQFCEGRYEVVDRPHRLVLTWGWTAESMGVAHGWTRFLARLSAVATNQEPDPYPTESLEERRRWLSTS